MTIDPFFKCFPIVSDAFFRIVRSGLLSLSIGVGRATIIISASCRMEGLSEKLISTSSNCVDSSSLVLSMLFINSLIRSLLISKPDTLYPFFAKACARGSPT